MDDDEQTEIATLGPCSLDPERYALARHSLAVHVCWLAVGIALLSAKEHLPVKALGVVMVVLYAFAGVVLTKLLRHVRERADSIDAVVEALRRWRAKTFADQPPEAVAKHLLREVQELQEALYTRLTTREPVTAQELVEETADVLILGLAMCDLIDASPAAILRHKFGVLERRRWSPPDHEGVIEHDRSEEDTHG